MLKGWSWWLDDSIDALGAQFSSQFLCKGLPSKEERLVEIVLDIYEDNHVGYNLQLRAWEFPIDCYYLQIPKNVSALARAFAFVHTQANIKETCNSLTNIG